MITSKRIDPRMIANNLTLYAPTHPGELLKEEIEYRGIKQLTSMCLYANSWTVFKP
jgi:hypothetical protein